MVDLTLFARAPAYLILSKQHKVRTMNYPRFSNPDHYNWSHSSLILVKTKGRRTHREFVENSHHLTKCDWLMSLACAITRVWLASGEVVFVSTCYNNINIYTWNNKLTGIVIIRPYSISISKQIIKDSLFTTTLRVSCTENKKSDEKVT